MRGIIKKISEEASDTRGFHIVLDAPLTYEPGQYIMLAFPDDIDTRRAFSIVDYDQKSSEVLLLIKKHGSFTEKIFSSNPGTKLIVFGPYGRFVMPKESKPVVFIAGGIGITPLYSMMLHAHNTSYDNDIHLFYSAKSLEDMPLYERLRDIDDDNIHIIYHLTKNLNPVEGHHTHIDYKNVHSRKKMNVGKRMDIDDIKSDVPNFVDCIYYICGPLPMIENFRSTLLAAGIPDDNIRSEEFT
jgi:ferredoxin-NADP reductase